jgi:leucyl aminopeptidase (aminopeptidase T)
VQEAFDKDLAALLWKYKNARNIAEFGIGLNPKAVLSGNTLEDEKVLGTCHIAFGSNFDFGGRIKSDVHWDAILLKPTIYVDDRKIMDEGDLLV